MIAPTFAPRIPHNPLVLSLADQDHPVVQLPGPAHPRLDSPAELQLPGYIRRHPYCDRRLRHRLHQRLVSPVYIDLPLHKHLSILLILVAGAVFAGVGDLALGRHAVVLGPCECVVHQSAVAAVVCLFAVDEFLFRQLEDGCGG